MGSKERRCCKQNNRKLSREGSNGKHSIAQLFEHISYIFSGFFQVVELSALSHPNLVALKGYCDEDGENILVFEFINNGTLRSHLHTSGFEVKRLGFHY